MFVFSKICNKIFNGSWHIRQTRPILRKKIKKSSKFYFNLKLLQFELGNWFKSNLKPSSNLSIQVTGLRSIDWICSSNSSHENISIPSKILAFFGDSFRQIAIECKELYDTLFVFAILLFYDCIFCVESRVCEGIHRLFLRFIDCHSQCCELFFEYKAKNENLSINRTLRASY